ncbi:MAG: hypothetical protein MJ014_02095, partial [Methanocorpusculum sp.]|nr:hypothetical protein [Methanocorpusculum sp.]
GQTVTYAYTVTAGAGDAARAAAARGLNEWMQTVDEMTEVAAASIVSRAAEMDPVEDSGWIAYRGDVKVMGSLGESNCTRTGTGLTGRIAVITTSIP